MEKSTSIKSLAKALITFHIKVDKVKKDAKNPFFKSRYASLSNILETINEPLIECGLCFSQLPTGENGLVTLLVHAESGEFIQSTYEMRPVKDDPQGRGSAITYQRRYALAAVLGLNIDEDDDGNAASKVTSYNHKPIEQNGKPLITNGLFKKLMERVEGGDNEAYKKAMETYSFEPEQKKFLDDAHKKLLV